MGWFQRLFQRSQPPAPPSPRPVARTDFPYLLLIHTHSKDSRPPGPLEDGFIELEQEDVVLHAVTGTIQPDGTICDLPEEKLEWAHRLTYRHLKREGCLAEFGIPIIPAYEDDESGTATVEATEP